jgi:thiol-disulfide isomerase/thioredoxin
MKTPILAFLFLACVARLAAAVNVGDTYAQVLQEKGLPPGKVEAGNVHILHYSDQIIRIKDGRVMAVDRAQAAGPTAPARLPVAMVEKLPTPAVDAAISSGLKWTTDYPHALAQAKEQHRQVFLFFTGSDWCVWCKRLQNEILTTPEFIRFAREKFILVELDFPRKKVLPKAVRAQNDKLAEKYGLEVYPTVIVLDSSGTKVGQVGYQPGGPGPFVEKLSKLQPSSETHLPSND